MGTTKQHQLDQMDIEAMDPRHPARRRISELEEKVRKLTRGAQAMKCSQCGGYSLALSEESRVCQCVSDPEKEEVDG